MTEDERDELARLDVTEQVERVRAGDVRAAELVEAAIRRAERIDPQVGALVSDRFDQAPDEAEDAAAGPLHGSPVLIKDLDVVSAGDPYYAGTAALRDAGFIADHDAYLVRRLRGAGAVPIGRTKVPELGLTVTTEPLAFGPTRNPWDLQRSPGGSSGGSAAAVAAGIVPAATGSDGGGSLRIPASACGIVGLKPTRARISYGPDRGVSWEGFSVLGHLARTVRDVALLMDVTAGRMPGDPYDAPPLPSLVDAVGAAVGSLRVGVMTTAPARAVDVDPQVTAVVEDVAAALADAGHEVERDHPEALEELQDLRRAFGRVTTASTARAVERLSQLAGGIGPEGLEPTTRAIAERGATRTATEHLAAVEWVHAWARRLASWWQDHDLLLTPTMPELPPRLGDLASDPDQPLRAVLRSSDLVVFTMPFNASGQPAISLPVGRSSEGLPIGAQLVAPFGREDLLVRVASLLERSDLWRGDDLPPVWA